MERDGAEYPDQPERRGGDQQRPAGPVSDVGDRTADHPRAQPVGEGLQRDRDERADQQRPHRGAERRVGRLRPLVEDPGADPASEEGPEAEADQSQRPDDQSLLIAPDGESQDEADYHPVQDGHGRK